ncbi:SagB family peptide dehydrogenase [Psychromicrobium sp. YIM B11713]|uniref:SagB family peptide dehydrogenase n=1 Tax=Psychromicrobium sp. YIM B11713 TaxID=3145233 RepID=UPI00374F4199
MPISLGRALTLRRSWYGRPITGLKNQDLADFLGWTAGFQTSFTHREEEAPHSYAPSAGNLPSLSCYLALTRATEDSLSIGPGLFRYLKAEHALVDLHRPDVQKQLQDGLVQAEFASYPALVIVVADMAATMRKYSARHYRTLHIDSGIMAQTQYLVTTALGLGGCCITGFSDLSLHRLLGLPSGSFPSHIFSLGRPEPAPPSGASGFSEATEFAE